MKRILRIIVAAALVAPLRARAADTESQEVVAVLSSASLPYQEALVGFRETYTGPLQVVTLSKDAKSVLTAGKVIVAFGGKAATSSYPPDSTLIYGLAPALFVDADRHPGPLIRIHMAPSPDILISKLKEIQPDLRRLAVFWISASEHANTYMSELEKAGNAQGVKVRKEYMARPEDLPERLRSLAGKVDALWMSPDPLLITPGTFAAAKEFSHTNNMPLYAPLDSFVDKGAVASVAASFKEIGRAAGRIASNLEESKTNEQNRYPEKYDVSLNLTAAGESGLKIPESVVKKADRVIP